MIVNGNGPLGPFSLVYARYHRAMTLPPQSRDSGADALTNAHLWHTHWKETLRAAAKNQESVDQALIERDDCCELGQWLYAVGGKRYGAMPEFQSLLVNHREFHLLASAVAQVINAKQYDLAEAYLSEGTQLARSSSEVDAAITRLQAVVSAP